MAVKLDCDGLRPRMRQGLRVGTTEKSYGAVAHASVIPDSVELEYFTIICKNSFGLCYLFRMVHQRPAHHSLLEGCEREKVLVIAYDVKRHAQYALIRSVNIRQKIRFLLLDRNNIALH